MHKYEKQNVSCGGTDAQATRDSIHTRHLVCLFDVAVRNRCWKMYAVQSLETSPGDSRIAAAATIMKMNNRSRKTPTRK
jgi:hypothetical protein